MPLKGSHELGLVRRFDVALGLAGFGLMLAFFLSASPAWGAGPSAGLPDGRAYEQITPPGIVEKNGNPLAGDELNVLAAAADGSASTYYAVTGAGETESAKQYPIYIATRGTVNWASEGVNPPSSLGNRLTVLGYTENLTGTYSAAYSLGGEGGIYLREAGGRVLAIASGLESTDRASELSAIAAESKGGGAVIFETPAAIPGTSAIAGVNNVYVWDKSSGEIKLVDVLPGNITPSAGAFAGPWDWLNEEIEVGVGGSRQKYYTESTLSEDGSRAFFTTADTHQIYLRTDPLSPLATTTLVSESKRTVVDPNGPKPADFLGATPDGAFVYFKSAAKLTNDATTGEFDEGSDLYRYEVGTGDLEDLTPLTETENGARVFGLAGSSKDGSFVYFVAAGVLAPGAVEGEHNLYLWHEGQVKLVAVLAGGRPDEEIWYGTRFKLSVRAQRQARVSEDGRAMIFASKAEVPGTIAIGETQIFRYTFGNEHVECISCNPSGVITEGPAALQSIPRPFIAPLTKTSRMTRNMSPDGQRVFFQTTEALVAGDTNEVADVYEWEADGTGSCTSSSQNGGCLYLISTGTSPEPSYFSDASVSGDDVFFFTTQSLVGQDTDDLSDAYDARVGGGLSAQNPIPVVLCETGQACRGQVTSAPAGTSPGTASLVGPENQKPVRCKKGFVRKGERCVRKSKKKNNKKSQRHKTKGGHKNGGQG